MRDLVIQEGMLFQHYKGNLYRVISLATHTETNEKMVIYKQINDRSHIWCRPLDNFLGEVNKNQKYRFELVI